MARGGAMGEAWFYAEGDARKGPVDLEQLRKLHAEKTLGDETQVWREGIAAGMPLGAVLTLAPTSAAERARGFLTNVGSKLSSLAGVPEIDDVPVQSVLTSGIGEAGPIEDTFAVGTSTTTPELADIAAGWPRPRVWWRILVGAVVTYLLLKVGISEFNNPRFAPGLIVIGSFVVPLSVVVFFFEMNTPRNVSAYQVGKMTLLGGAISLVVTMVLTSIIPGSGAGRLVPAFITGAVEETAKTLALVLIVRETRWSWQLNGLLFGAAVGAGFSGYESAGYAVESSGMLYTSILWRALLSPGGHVIWTAMIGAAVWQVRGKEPFDWAMLFDKIVLRRWGVAVVLHGFWDTDIISGAPILQCIVLLLIGWYFVFAVMKQGLAEVAIAKSEASASS
jgi:RsiW-degrading membrane proteinase PrsW (M82 family)